MIGNKEFVNCTTCGINKHNERMHFVGNQIPQYRSAKSVLQVLEKLTYQKFGGLEELDVMAEGVDNEIHG